MIHFEVQEDNIMSEYPATAKASRSRNSLSCMQNFSIFEYKNSTYMIVSGYKNDTVSGEEVQRVKLQLLKYNPNDNIFFF